eukprot:989242-Amphidinium_carterae.5
MSVEKAARDGKPCPDVPKKFRRLSLKLGIAVDKIAVLRKEQQEKGKTLSGLLMYHMLLEQYKFSANSSSYFDMKRIQSLRCNGDEDLQRFLADWDTTRMRMKEQPSEYMLTRLFWEQFRNCRDFSYIFEQYENADEHSYKKKYRWLRDQIDKTLQRRKVESNMRQGLRHFRDSQPRSNNAMPFTSRSPSRNRSTSPRSKGGDRRGHPMEATVTGRDRQGNTYKRDRTPSRGNRLHSPRRDDRRRSNSPRNTSRGRNTPRRNSGGSCDRRTPRRSPSRSQGRSPRRTSRDRTPPRSPTGGQRRQSR